MGHGDGMGAARAVLGADNDGFNGPVREDLEGPTFEGGLLGRGHSRWLAGWWRDRFEAPVNNGKDG